MKNAIVEFNQLGPNADPKIKEQLIQDLHDRGYVLVRNVPEHLQLYNRFLAEGRKFLNSDAEKKACSPAHRYSHGWSFGEEAFHGVPDSFKGSYYGDWPETPQNVWPIDHPEFREAYLDLTRLIVDTGCLILKTIDLYIPIASKSRFLQYGCVNKDIDDGNPNWCGSHLDHGYFTGLCASRYFKDGVRVEEPEGAGLYVRGQKVVIPDDCLAFQVGEALQLVSNGQVVATEHHVAKANGHERLTFVSFMNLPDDYVISSADMSFPDRYKPGMSYGEWATASFAKYASLKSN